MPPKVSVIIPAYNSSRYLAETIESVLAQSYREFEVIVVDDGSTDETLAVAQRFAPTVRALTKANGGPASARNLAMQHASGDYLAFLDSDDLWVADKLEKQVAFLESNPQVALCYGQAVMFSGEADQKIERERIGYTGEASFALLLLGDFLPNSTVVLRSTCRERVGWLNEDRELIAGEDYEYWLRVAKEFPLAGLSEVLAYYRLRDGSLLGDGADTEKGLRLSLAVLSSVEKLYPRMWDESGIEKQRLLARLHIRAGFAWKQRGQWRRCFIKFRDALRLNASPRVLRWIIAATLLKRWS